MTTMALPVPLIAPGEDGRRQLSPHWCEARGGDLHGLALYRRHYSCDKPGAPTDGNHRWFGGPGEKLILVSPTGDALFVWRRERFRRDGQLGVNCAVFRNEGPVQSSLLIREAMTLAWDRWPGARLFTFVDPAKIRSNNPGYCFLKAGWSRCQARTSVRRLRILDVQPWDVAEGASGKPEVFICKPSEQIARVRETI